MFAPKRTTNVMEMFKTSCFLAAIPWHQMGTRSNSTTVPPIRALRWLRAAFAAFWLGWMPTAIPSNTHDRRYASDHLVLLPAHFSLGTRESIWCTWPDTEKGVLDLVFWP